MRQTLIPFFLQGLTQKLPTLPAHAPMLSSMLSDMGDMSQKMPDLTTQVTHLGTVDGATSRALPSHDSNNSTMSTEGKPSGMAAQMPSEIAQAKRCADAGVIAAWSEWVPARMGLFPTKRFQTGDVILTGASAMGRWIPVADASPEAAVRAAQDAGMERPMTIVAVTQVHMFRQASTMILVGDPRRDLWAVMQCSCGHTGWKPNVTVEFQHGDMGDDFLGFKVVVDIEPFDGELV